MVHCFSVVDNFDGKFVKSNYRAPFHRRVCHRWMASKYHCKPAWKPRTAKEIAKLCFANWTKRQHLSPVSLFSSSAWLLSHDTQPNVRTNLLTNFRTWIALTGKCWGKVHRGKRSCVQLRFCTFFILVIRIKMRVWVLFSLQIESPIRQYVH